MKRLHVLAWLAAVSLLAAAGCKSGSGKTKVAFVSNNAESFWSIAEVGANKAADEEGVELLFKKPAQGDTQVQKREIDQVMSQGIGAIAISVINPKNQNNYLKSISGKIPLLTQDNDAPDSGRLCYIGTDNYAAGRAAGALVKQAMPKGGVVAIFVGQVEPLNAQQRRQGVLDELAGKKDVAVEDGATYGKYRLYKTYTDQPEGRSECKRHAVQCLADLEDEKDVCLVGLWAYNPPAILSAAKTAGKLGQVKIVGFDEDTATLDGIKAGHVYGTVVQQPYEFGYRSVKLMAAITRGDKSGIPDGGIVNVPHLAITQGGKDVTSSDGKKHTGKAVDVFAKDLKKLLGTD